MIIVLSLIGVINVTLIHLNIDILLPTSLDKSTLVRHIICDTLTVCQAFFFIFDEVRQFGHESMIGLCNKCAVKRSTLFNGKTIIS